MAAIAQGWVVTWEVGGQPSVLMVSNGYATPEGAHRLMRSIEKGDRYADNIRLWHYADGTMTEVPQ